MAFEGFGRTNRQPRQQTSATESTTKSVAVPKTAFGGFRPVAPVEPRPESQFVEQLSQLDKAASDPLADMPEFLKEGYDPKLEKPPVSQPFGWRPGRRGT